MGLRLNNIKISGGLRADIPQVVTDGLVFWMDPDNSISYPGSGTTVYNLASDAGKTGVFVGNTAWNAAGYFSLDGVGNTYINTVNMLADPATWDAAVTLEIWAYFDSDGTWSNGNRGGLVSRGSTFGTFGLIRATANDRVSMWLRTDVAGFQVDADITGRNQWNCITGVWDGINELRIYINGQLQNSINTVVKSGTPDQNNYGMGGMGSTLSGSPGNSMKGRIGQVLIYPAKALTQAEITQNFQARRLRFGV